MTDAIASTNQPNALIQAREDFVAVLAQQVERNVVGTGHVNRVELPRCADVEDARGVAESIRARRSAESIVTGVCILFFRSSIPHGV
jgi:hypothetical protein